MDISFASAVVILLLVMDPIGNIPLFVSLLRNLEPARRVAVIVRECAIAFAVLLAFVFFGKPMLDLLGLSDSSLNIAGGVILFLIALRMIFKHVEGIFGDTVAGEPFIVPLAIPSIAGPTALATVILMVSRAPDRMLEWVVALTVAMAVTLLLLLFAERISKWVGERGLLALERLMGLVLTAIAVEMLLRGIEAFVRQLQNAG
ncbi:MAG: MarC family protein [Burkholderiales bacterium]|nr:MarC family protein [Burkholderiales bacterium]